MGTLAAAGARFRLLGPLEVGHPDGGAVELGGPRPRELLALLLLHPHQVVSRDRLIAALWGETATDGAATTLRTHIHAVRRALARAGAGDELETRPGGYVLAVDPDDIDAAVFERLVHRGQEALALGHAEEALRLIGDALALWRGEPLADLGPPDFAEAAVARLGELWLVAREGDATAQLAVGRHRQVVGPLQELVAQHPFREELCALLMLALFRSGRQVDALAVYAAARERLQDELGLDPGPRLRELEIAMLRQDPALLLGVPETLPDPAVRGAAQPEDAVFATLRRTAMVGREADLAGLEGAWRDALAGRAGLVTVAGPAGVGKSRLVAQLAHRAAEDQATVLVGRCDDPVPAGALATAFAGSPRVRALLADAPAAVRRSLGGLLPTDAWSAAHDDAADRPALFRATEWLLSALLAGGPVLLVVEDAERLDETGSALLGHLVTRLSGELLVAVCFRDPPGSRHLPLLDLLGHGNVHGLARRLVLQPLDRDGVAAMVEARTGIVPTGTMVAELAARTAGNPFFLHELLRDLDRQDLLAGHLPHRVPDGVRDVLRHRLRSLPESTRTAVSGAAVLGREVELLRLERLLEEPEDSLVAALDGAVAAGFLVESGQSWAGGFAFPHDLMREAVHDELPVHRRHRLHLRAVDVLLAGTPSDADVIAAAGHACEAGAAADPGEAAELLHRATRLAATGFGYEEAVRLAEARLALLRRTAPPAVQAEAAVGVAQLRLKAGRGYERAVELFEDALTAYLALGDTESAGVVHSRLGGTLAVPRRGMDVARSLDHFAAAERLLSHPDDAFHLHRGRMSAAMHGLDSRMLGDAAARCAELAAELGRRDLASAADWGRAWRAMNLGRPSEAFAHLDEGWSEVQGLGDPLLGWPLANGAALMCTAYLLDPEGGRAWCRRGLGQPRFDTLAHQHDALVDQLVLALAETGELDAARRASERLPASSVGRRLVTFLVGDRQRAADAWEEALAEDRAAGDRHDAGLNARWLAEALLALGQEERAVEVLHEALTVAAEAPQVPLEVWLRARLAQLASTPLTEADQHLARCEGVVASGPEDWRGLLAEVQLARAAGAARQGDLAGAETALDDAVTTFTAYRLPWRVAAAHRLGAMVLSEAGREEEAARRRDRAEAVLAHVGAPRPRQVEQRGPNRTSTPSQRRPAKVEP